MRLFIIAVTSLYGIILCASKIWTRSVYVASFPGSSPAFVAYYTKAGEEPGNEATVYALPIRPHVQCEASILCQRHPSSITMQAQDIRSPDSSS